MSSEILVNVTPSETRAAIVEDGVLQEVYIERTSCRGIVGNIYKGKVNRVLPGMEAAFVDIGLERTAFLHVSDILIPAEQTGDLESIGETPPIKTLLRPGQQILVQVIKDPMGTKGARLTTQLSISSRYLVYLPDTQGIGVSLKIGEEKERERLIGDVAALIKDTEHNNGYIIRTVAEGVSSAELAVDLQFLHQLWAQLQTRKRTLKPGAVLHQDLPLAMRVMRDLMCADVERIRFDSKETYEAALAFSADFMPDQTSLLSHNTGKQPIFDLFSVEAEINHALNRSVPLKSGGYLIFDQTEAMTTVDVNTGGFVGVSTLEETIFKTNLEAADAIARQLRLRNLGGIIILDFIDMAEESHRDQVWRALGSAMASDRARHHICEVSELGLIEMTRRRVRESLGHVLCEPCPSCGGKGEVKTAETLCYEIFREIMRVARQYETTQFLVLASIDVIDRMQDEDSTKIAELEQFIGKQIKFQPEIQYHREQFNVVLM